MIIVWTERVMLIFMQSRENNDLLPMVLSQMYILSRIIRPNIQWWLTYIKWCETLPDSVCDRYGVYFRHLLVEKAVATVEQLSSSAILYYVTYDIMMFTSNTSLCRLATWYGLPVSDTDCGAFLSDTAVLHFDTDFNQIYGDHIMSLYASQNYSTME